MPEPAYAHLADTCHGLAAVADDNGVCFEQDAADFIAAHGLDPRDYLLDTGYPLSNALEVAAWLGY